MLNTIPCLNLQQTELQDLPLLNIKGRGISLEEINYYATIMKDKSNTHNAYSYNTREHTNLPHFCFFCG